MSFAASLKAGVSRHLTNLKVAHARHVAAAEARAKKALERAKTKAEKEKVLASLERAKQQARTELYEARKATMDAKLAAQRAKKAFDVARREAGDLTIGERLGAVSRELERTGRQTYKALVKPSARRKRRPTGRPRAEEDIFYNPLAGRSSRKRSSK